MFVWKIKNTPNCDYCGQIDNLEHFFFYCPDTYHFWDQIRTWFVKFGIHNINLTVLEVLFGLVNLQPKLYFLVNYVVLVAKSYIRNCKKNNKNLLFKIFLKELKWKLKLEEMAYINTGRPKVYSDRFVLMNEMLV